MVDAGVSDGCLCSIEVLCGSKALAHHFLCRLQSLHAWLCPPHRGGKPSPTHSLSRHKHMAL